MTFPDTPLDLRAELLLNGTWTDVSSRLDRGSLTIGRGHPDESATVSPSTLDCPLNNDDAALSPDNAVSPYYPYLLQNVPVRVSIPEGASYMRSESDTSSGASAHVAATTGDIDAAADVTLDSAWTRAARLAGQWSTSSPARSWIFGVDDGGTLSFARTTDGTLATYAAATSTQAVTAPPSGRMSARVTYDHLTGTVTFYTGTSVSGPWTQLGSAVTLAAGALYSLAALPVDAGAPLNDTDASTTAAWPGYQGKYHALTVRSAIGGTVLASPDFTAYAAGTTSFTDAQGNTWTLAGTAETSDRDYRGHFEASEWAQEQGPTGHEVTARMAGGGLLRRYGQRSVPLRSAVYRLAVTTTAAPLAAYWPMEDAAGASSLGSAAGGRAMTWVNGTPTLSSSSAFAGSDALPVCNKAQFTGIVAYSGTWTANDVQFLLYLPAADNSAANAAVIYTGGTIARLEVVYTAGSGTLSLYGLDSSGNSLFAGAASVTPPGSGVNGLPCAVQVTIRPSGGNVTAGLSVAGAGDPSGTSGTVTVAGSVGAVTRVVLNEQNFLSTFANQLNSAVFGHAMVYAGYTGAVASRVNPYELSDATWTGPLAAWNGEPAGIRAGRLAAEEGIQFRGRGDLARTTSMGVQQRQTVSALVQQCADADQGVWFETRQCLGWGYVTRGALYNQAAALALDYAADHLSMWQAPPVRDDQVIVNDVTYSSSGGSSSRQTAMAGNPVTGGRLSAAPPPAGVGAYDQSYSVAVHFDSVLPDLATWRLHRGTVDQPRFPGIVVDLSNRDLAALTPDALALDLGQRLTIANPPAYLGRDTVTQLAQQLAETLGPYELEIAVTGVPESPYEVAADGFAYHVDTDGTTLGAGVTSSATSLSFVTAPGFPVWTTSAADFPFDVTVAGERMTVTNITGASSPQTATVTRSVNGVVKAQALGAAVNVYPPPVAAL